MKLYCGLGRETRERRDGEKMLACGCVIEVPITQELIDHAREEHGVSERQLRDAVA